MNNIDDLSSLEQNYVNDFKAEYHDLVKRLDTFTNMLNDIDMGVPLKPRSPMQLLQYQHKIMSIYKRILDDRIKLEGLEKYIEEVNKS